MTARLKFAPARDSNIFAAMRNLSATVRGSGLEHSLILLIKTRVSQINGCAYCVDMHTKDARAAGETQQRLYPLNAWRKTSLYSDRECAALEWAEAVTRVENQRVPQDVYQSVRNHFSEQEMMALTLCVVEINGWNRFSIAFQFPAGDYRLGQFEQSGNGDIPHFFESAHRSLTEHTQSKPWAQ
jgi:AhpD family alkylhydroperoxidase